MKKVLKLLIISLLFVPFVCLKAQELLDVPYLSISGNNNSLILNWNEYDSETLFDIYRSTSPTKGYKLINTVLTNTWVNTGLKYGSTYYYKIVARNNNDKSGYSNIVSKKVVPNKVDNLSISSASATSVKLTYKVSGAKGYAIYRSTSPTSGFKQIKVTTSSSYEDKKLKTGTTYYYKVRAFVLNKKKKVYGDYSDVYKFEVKLVKPTVKIVNNSRSSLEISLSSSNSKCSYEVSRLDSNKVVETKTGSKVIFDDLNYGSTYKFKAVAYKTINGKRHVSDEVYFEEKIRPKMPEASFEKQVIYDMQKVKYQFTDLQANDIINIKMYRSTSENGTYSLIQDFDIINDKTLVTPEGVEGPHTKIGYYLPSLDVKFNQKYYYKIVTTINGVEAKPNYLSSLSQVKPDLTISPSYTNYLNIMSVFPSNNKDDIIYYELSRSTSKKGKWKVVLDRVLYPDETYNVLVFADVYAPYNKQYYYKLRFYRYENNKKIYSNYSDVVSYKNLIKSFNKFPVYLEANSIAKSKFTIKSVNFSLVKTDGVNSTYKAKINFKSTYSTISIYNTIKMKLYDINDNELSELTITVLTPKGTKKNWSTTTNSFTLPSNAMYYSFE